MTSFVIVGTGGMGRELLGWINGCREEIRERFKVEAFISEADDAGSSIYGVPVFHPEKWRGDRPRFVIAFADPVKKKRLALLLEAMGWTPEIFIHDLAAVGPHAKIGRGTVICPGCRISNDCDIGEHVLVNGGSGVGHDAKVGSYSSLLGSVSVNGNAQVGEGVTFGAGSMVYPGKRIGDWARIGLGSVVLKNVREGATMFGNPAKRIDSD